MLDLSISCLSNYQIINICAILEKCHKIVEKLEINCTSKESLIYSMLIYTLKIVCVILNDHN